MARSAGQPALGGQKPGLNGKRVAPQEGGSLHGALQQRICLVIPVQYLVNRTHGLKGFHQLGGHAPLLIPIHGYFQIIVGSRVLVLRQQGPGHGISAGSPYLPLSLRVACLNQFPGRRKRLLHTAAADQFAGQPPGRFRPNFRIPDPGEAFLPVVQNSGQAFPGSEHIRHETGQFLESFFITLLDHYRRGMQGSFIVTDAVGHVIRQKLQQQDGHAQAQGNQPFGA